jgi:hypothetical protein
VSANAWIFIGKKRPADPVTGLFDAYGKWSETKASGVAGGDFTKDAWRKRVFNTENSDDSNLGTLASGQLTLEAGTYVGSAKANGHEVDRHAIQLFDTTGAAVLINGMSADCSGSNVTTTASMQGKFTIGVQSVLEIQHYCRTTQATTGFGNPVTIGGRDEVYATIELWRVL